MKKNANHVKKISEKYEDLPNNRASDYTIIKKRLSSVNKSIYKTGLVYDPVALLEKSAITGRIFEKKEPKPKKKPKIPQDPLSVSLKVEHKNTESVKIYQLPKLPFGNHESYNEELSFVQNHFKFDDSVDELSKNLDILTRKFRLNDKNRAKRAKSSQIKRRMRLNESPFRFKMESGTLICNKDKGIIEIYDNDKARYAKKDGFRDSDMAKREKIIEKFHEIAAKKKSGSDIVQRLYPVREESDTPISKFYKSKYSALFNESESSTRPVTSFQIGNWKKLLNL